MSNILAIRDLSVIDEVAKEFLEKVQGRSVIAFYAPMGGGKTTFTSAICRALGVRNDAVSSPTFAIVNEYRSGVGTPIYHFDFYRIENITEALDIGFFDYVDSGNLCIIEWPENIEQILPDETLKVQIRVLEDGTRLLEW